ncbi:MAG: PQQ-binding-like beta-propeller repeat protein [Dehalococcoidia bacterium]
MSSKRRRAPVRSAAWGVPLLALVLLAAGCASVDKPDGWAPPEIAEDTLYLSVDSGKITAVDPDSYATKWEFPDGEQSCGNESPKERDLDGIYSAPIVADGKVYLGAWDKNVYGIDAATGECLWSFETDDRIIGRVALDDAGLYVASTDGTLYVLDPETGEETAHKDVGDVWSSPVIVDGVLYVGTMGGKLTAFDPATLAEKWDASFSVSSALLTDPTPVNGSVLVGGIGQELYAVDAETGDEQWSVSGSNWFWGRPVVEDGTVYATNLDGSVIAIDLATGDRLWKFATETPVRAGAVVAGGFVIAVDDQGHVYGIDPETGQLAWNGPTEIDKSVLADPYLLADGSVMIISKGGDVFTVDPADGRLTTIRIEG